MTDSERADAIRNTELLQPKTPFQQHYREAFDQCAKGDAKEAARLFMLAAVADPEKFCDAIIKLGKQGHPEVALAALFELLKLPSNDMVKAGAWCSIGNVYCDQGINDKAYEAFVKSWNISPSPGCASNRAMIHMWRDELNDAQHWINRSLTLRPWLSDAQFVQSMISFMRGDFRTGFAQYESRWRSRGLGLRKIPSNKPELNLEEHKTGTVLIYQEQGIGDLILALRYAKDLKARGFKQTWVIQNPIKPLMASMVIIDKLVSPGEDIGEYDYHLPIMSLPRVFEVIDGLPYISIRPMIQPRLDLKQVGIAWKGSKANGNNAIRSALLPHWEPVLAVDGVQFHSLQVDDSEEALAYPKINIWPKPVDWMQTAIRIRNLDLIITVDTAIMHLAGAMGVPCWCALHCRPYFVFPLSKDDCPWYKSVRLFKQKREHQWKEVFENIAGELRKL